MVEAHQGERERKAWKDALDGSASRNEGTQGMERCPGWECVKERGNARHGKMPWMGVHQGERECKAWKGARIG
ncbi:hypothetical protein SAMN05192532_103377 [Alteribacillus iranensis]|uniref:Uncharacterized protein n=1 Tax=Alteribacillus iranensis TaxID=930128 RepID=A0A1I2D366_9BACI|nr:hypothetical protein SAMN05192532_103377 [Alteribacillus iranensis]